tara:strand:+ start:3416 stop:3712 length:297 start_codon:yes stop_codon:yes gene_type:complete
LTEEIGMQLPSTASRYFSITAISVVLTTLYIWGKVEVSELMQQIGLAKAEIVSLSDERTRLTADVIRAKKPAVIVRRAELELRMIPLNRYHSDSKTGE